MSVSDRVDELDLSLFDQIQTGGTSSRDRRSLLALHAALAARGDFGYLEVGSYLGASLQSFIADPRCRRIVSVDRRDAISVDERGVAPDYPNNTTAHMLERLSKVPEAELEKLTTIEASTEKLDAAELSADLCFIDAEHTNAAALRDARFCRQVIRERGVIVFHHRTLVGDAVRQFLAELSRHRAYPLAHDLFVVEINVPSLLSDPRVRAQVPHRAWLVVDRLGAMSLALRLSPMVGLRRRAFGFALARRVFGRIALTLGAPHRSRRRPQLPTGLRSALFEIYTFVNDDALYERMRKSFIDAGFSPDAFVRLTDGNDDPYSAINRIGQESTARYPILCHQDVRADQGAGAIELVAAVEQLDKIDPHWVVAGNAGVMRSGRVLKRLVDPNGGFTGESLPLPAVTLDENFLVFNSRNAPRCSAGLSDFHLYGSDVCLHALSSGGSAYVIEFPVTHLGAGSKRGLERANDRFIAAWSEHCRFCYVLTTVDTLFISRSKVLHRLFGSSWAVARVAQHRHALHGLPLRRVDRLSSLQLVRRRETRAARPEAPQGIRRRT
jgi:hypothetical protein